MVGCNNGNIMQCYLVCESDMEEYDESQVHNAYNRPKYSLALKAKVQGLIFNINLE